jgi:hypothetical protein
MALFFNILKICAISGVIERGAYIEIQYGRNPPN